MAEDEPAVETPGSAAKSEAARQAVYLAAMVIAIPVAAWLQRATSDPDAAKSLRMRAAKAAERVTAGAAARCWKLAERARLAYDRECL